MQTETARTIQQSAQELGLSPATLRAWIRQRRIGYIRLGRAVRIPASEIRRLIEQGTVPAVTGPQIESSPSGRSNARLANAKRSER
jgi:excisionase family DNA binding protein